MVEKGIRGGICQATHAKANNKYMSNYDKNIESSSYIELLDANNLYGLTMSQKLPVDGFKCVKNLSKFNEDFIQKYDEKSNKGYFLEVDVEYLEKLLGLDEDLPFLTERKKIFDVQKYTSFLPKRKKVENVKKLVCDTKDKEK